MDYATAWRAAEEITAMLAETGVNTHAKHHERAADIIAWYATANEKALLQALDNKPEGNTNWLDDLMKDVEMIDAIDVLEKDTERIETLTKNLDGLTGSLGGLPLAAEPDTDKMLAGSRLNATVAQEVMGWKYAPAAVGGPAFWQDPEKNFERGLISPPFYSTEIVLAIKVAVKLIFKYGCHFDLWSDPSTEWRATFYVPDLSPLRGERRERRVIGATGSTPSHAICLAAIKVKKAIEKMLKENA